MVENNVWLMFAFLLKYLFYYVVNNRATIELLLRRTLVRSVILFSFNRNTDGTDFHT